MTDTPAGVIVPVTRSVTLRQTVGYVIQRALDQLADGEPPQIHFVFIASWRADDPGSTADRKQADELLEQVTTWSQFDLEEDVATEGATGQRDTVNTNGADTNEDGDVIEHTESTNDPFTVPANN